MYLTSEQIHLISDTYGIKVRYSSIWKKMHQIGFCYKDHDGYHVKVDKKLSKEARKIVLIHELGHIELEHLKINEYKEKATVDDIIAKVGAPKDLINRKLNGGFHEFINICIDLEVNSKFLTFENYEVMRNETKTVNGEEVKLGVLNIEDWDMEYQSDFRGYYEPVILRLMNEEDCAMSKAMDTLKDWAKSMQESADRGQGEGQMISDSELRISISSNESKPGQRGQQSSNSTSGGLGVKSDKGGFSPKSSESNKRNTPRNSRKEYTEESEDAKDFEDYNEDSEPESTVGQEFRENIDNQNRTQHSGYGTAYSNNSFELTNKNSIKMKEFLTSLISRQNTRLLDSIKLYNRGIRRNPQGLLYTSTRTKRNTNQMKLGILIDVSGSMDIDEVSAAINSLGELKLSLHPQSKVVLWSTDLNQEWLITDKFPIHPNQGGGTDMLKGIQYLLKDRFTDIVVYSDWETPYMNNIIKLAKANNIYSIFVGTDMNDKYNKELCRELKKWIVV